MKTEVTNQAVKGAPAVVGTVWSAMTLNEWVALLTGLYIAVQMFYLLRKWWHEEKEWASKDAASKG